MRGPVVRPLLALSLALLATVALSACSTGQAASTKEKPGDGIEVYQGTHTVRHSTAPLPSAEQPQTDGRHTLVWFSATW